MIRNGKSGMAVVLSRLGKLSALDEDSGTRSGTSSGLVEGVVGPAGCGEMDGGGGMERCW